MQGILQMNLKGILPVKIKVGQPCASEGGGGHFKLPFPENRGIRQTQRPLYDTVYGLSRLVGNMQVSADVDRDGKRIGVRLLIDFAVFLTGEQDGCKHTLLGILKRFPVPVVVNACPGSHRPDVV